VTAHIRRANTRDMLDPAPDDDATSVLNKRRRILRRGLPYGTTEGDSAGDGGEHGIIFMGLCASLFRQFEFVQQQWLQFGFDFNVGNDTCPVTGHRQFSGNFVIAADPASQRPPFICANMPTFVTTRGGEYFFIPSLTALRMIGMGVIDPT
jgi:deferrochelatase/peroxidase EfeB